MEEAKKAVGTKLNPSENLSDFMFIQKKRAQIYLDYFSLIQDQLALINNRLKHIENNQYEKIINKLDSIERKIDLFDPDSTMF